MDSTTFFNNLSKNRILTSVLIEITRKCNWHCNFCYLGSERTGEFPTDRLFDLFYEIKQLGCVKVAFTGGEPFIRNDAMELFQKVRRLGMICEVNTNGALVEKFGYTEVSDLFGGINISLHSHIAKVHDRLVGVDGAWETTVKTIRKLKEINANVAINSVITNSTILEFSEFENFVNNELECEWHPDIKIMPTYAGGIDAIERYQINTEQIAKILRQDSTLIYKTTDEKTYCTGVCKAGRNTCFIDVNGQVYPCITFKRDTLDKYELLKQVQSVMRIPMQEIWNNNPFLLQVGRVNADDFVKCKMCDSYKLCFKCMAENYFATGNLTTPSDRICDEERFYAQQASKHEYDTNYLV